MSQEYVFVVATWTPSIRREYVEIPFASVAVNETVTIPETVEPAEGEVMETEGGVKSPPGPP